eukprot:Skav218327  [mRNA]  locus=scaffold2239:382046:384042:+ [translate_table: standard]
MIRSGAVPCSPAMPGSWRIAWISCPSSSARRTDQHVARGSFPYGNARRQMPGTERLPERCQDGSKQLSKKVMERQYENYKDVIVDQDA